MGSQDLRTIASGTRCHGDEKRPWTTAEAASIRRELTHSSCRTFSSCQISGGLVPVVPKLFTRRDGEWMVLKPVLVHGASDQGVSVSVPFFSEEVQQGRVVSGDETACSP